MQRLTAATVTSNAGYGASTYIGVGTGAYNIQQIPVELCLLAFVWLSLCGSDAAGNALDGVTLSCKRTVCELQQAQATVQYVTAATREQ